MNKKSAIRLCLRKEKYCAICEYPIALENAIKNTAEYKRREDISPLLPNKTLKMLKNITIGTIKNSIIFKINENGGKKDTDVIRGSECKSAIKSS